MSNKNLFKNVAGALLTGVMAFIMSAGVSMAAGTEVPINETNFPDEGFRAYVEQTADTDGNKILSQSEIDNVTYINIRSRGIKNLKGIEHFTSLRVLNCGGNSLSTINVKSNTNLLNLNVSNNSLKEINVDNNKALKSLQVSGNELQSVDVSANTALESLDVSSNDLTSIDVSKCSRLVTLITDNNQISTVDLKSNTELTTVNMADNKLVYIDLKANTYVSTLNVANNNIAVLDVTSNSALSYLDCSYNEIIDVKLPESLGTLVANNNKISRIDLSSLKVLRNLNVSSNSIYNIDLSGNSKLAYLDVSGNNLASLDISGTALNKENVLASGNSRQVYVSSNVADISNTGIDLNRINGIGTVDVATGSALTIGKDGKVPSKVEYTYDAGNNISLGFTIIPVTSKAILTGSKDVNMYIVKGEKQPEYPLSVITLGGASDIKWSSLDSRIVTVNENGVCVPVGVGQTSVTASAEGYDTALITVNVFKEGEGVVISTIDNQYYTGKEVCPSPEVKLGDKTLVKDVDYTLSYQNNINVGTAYITVRGKGNYSFEVTKKFRICYNIATMISDSIADQIYTGNEITPKVVIKNGNYTLVQDVDYTISYTNNKELGTALVNITGKGDYTGIKYQSFNIIVPQVANLKVSKFYWKKLDLTWDKIDGVAGYRIYRYNYSTKKYTFLKQLNGKDTNTFTDTGLKSGNKYRYKVRAFVVVNGKNVYGKYTPGYTTYTKPVKVTLKAAAGSKKATLTWNKSTGATGYRIYMKKGSGNYSMIKEIKKGATVKYTKSGLTKGTSYSFKIRPYRTIDGKKVYGKYSSVKTIKAK